MQIGGGPFFDDSNKNDKIEFDIYIENDVLLSASIEAHKMGITLNDFINRALEEEIKRRENEIDNK